ncbi:molecular chaperone [Conexibacter sp. DBS9H8]|uniref:TorD/DmsD family molecular chaperone n=1 Tax=Conexibacter sp. DBS9H8 TaxID=2937801 RepID=UPI00200F798C|nr:molecular chaperone TorD family protein [Conexibacter sp. DBS9H8]
MTSSGVGVGGETAGDRAATAMGDAAAGRWEVLRALGSVSRLAPPDGAPVLAALGLPGWSKADHTRLFVLELPPYASIHLGPEGKLGGEGSERIAGMWRALGLEPPADCDHLATLLAFYAHLGESSGACRTAIARDRLEHARSVLLWEHLATWLPGYLHALSRDPTAGPWCDLLGAALRREAAESEAPAGLPVALRDAVPPISDAFSLDELLDALVAPIRVGFILTFTDLTLAAGQVGAGLRRGERRYALRALLEQEPAGTLGWLGQHASAWAEVHGRGGHVSTLTAGWWRQRALDSATVLHRLSDLARDASVPAASPAAGERGR